MIRNTPYGKRIQSKIQRETSDHMSRTAYHPALIPGGYNGHFMNSQQFLQHPGQMGMNPMGMSMNQMGGDFGRNGSPYMNGNGGGHMGMQGMHNGGGNGSMGSMQQGQQQFQPFQQQQQQLQQNQVDYQQSNNGYAPFM